MYDQIQLLLAWLAVPLIVAAAIYGLGVGMWLIGWVMNLLGVGEGARILNEERARRGRDQ